MKKDSLDDERSELSPWLREQREKGDGFRLPDGYFEGLEARVFERIDAGAAHHRPALRVVKKNAGLAIRPRAALALAAALSLVLAAVWFFRSQPTEVLAPIASVELTDEEIEAYVLSNVHDFEAQQLASLPTDESFEPDAPTEQSPRKARHPLDDLKPEDVDALLNDMTEEELEDLL
jgi:hypothetical protein